MSRNFVACLPAIFIASVLIGVIGFAISDSQKDKKILVAWLECQRRGDTGYEYWIDDPWPSKTRFFALQSYEIVDSPFDGFFVVRIHSSTKGGTPIVCHWAISIDSNGKIYKVENNEERLKDLERLGLRK